MKTGLLKIRLYRPFDISMFVDAIRLLLRKSQFLTEQRAWRIWRASFPRCRSDITSEREV